MKFGLNQIPAVTLFATAVQVLLYLEIIKIPWEKNEICLSAARIIKHHDYRRLFFASFVHLSGVHLFGNMVYFLIVGSLLEHCCGSKNLAILILMISVLCSVIYVALGLMLTEVLQNLYYARACVIGFSGVLYALTVLLTRYGTLLGIEYTHYYPWIKFVVDYLTDTNVSFMGHFAAICTGLIYTSTPVGKMMDGFISSLTGEPMIHNRRY